MDRVSPLKIWAQGARKALCAGAIAGAVLLLIAPIAGAQKNNKNSKDVQLNDDSASLASNLPLADPQAIEYMISQMLAAWQVGDDQMLQTFYADDVLVVSGVWEPPLQGKQNYIAAYKAQRARSQSVRMDRTNTFTKVLGNAAWCTYQWEFSAQVDGQPLSAFGQTTLVLEKRAGKWLIAVNHTSASSAPPRPVSQNAPNTSTPKPVATKAPGY